MDRRTDIADAALTLVARDGMRALTHRAIDSALGYPAGSTSYYFRTKSDLLAAVAAHLVELSRASFVSIAVSESDVATVVAQYLHDALTHRLVELEARYALMLDPAVAQDVRAVLARSLFSLERARVLFDDPEHGDGLVSLCEGLVADVVFGRRISNDVAALRFPIAVYLEGVEVKSRVPGQNG
ncbi:putative TetR family transcriptional regulator [Rhodococcus sp. AW25M09]|uniref:TetR/AcrR family transcriptional regulator n=1 Tax=Rhodococcus sp. AW25M09 TaxID=1268303 RepID=UPI0002ACDB26|nr:TetR family transcriptional regulator [Rhodococcus sp. AW25M09]CCQ13911.1 putative TetR family transcriptional regulator [Rhodococcus sp. AW25M09]